MIESEAIEIIGIICFTLVALAFIAAGGLKYLMREDSEKEDLIKELEKKNKLIEKLKAQHNKNKIEVRDIVAKYLVENEIPVEMEETLLNFFNEVNNKNG